MGIEEGMASFVKGKGTQESVRVIRYYFPSTADDDVKILIATDKELRILDRRTGIHETLVPVKSRPSSVAYDLNRNMYFWVDRVLNVFVFGRPNSVPLYPGLFVCLFFALKFNFSRLLMLLIIRFLRLPTLNKRTVLGGLNLGAGSISSIS